jgi:hypothetical protein
VQCSSGLWVSGKAVVSLTDVEMLDTGVGLLAEGSAEVRVSGAVASGSAFGAIVTGKAALRLEDAEITQNTIGLFVRDEGDVTLVDVAITENEFDGVKAEGKARVEIDSGKISKNGLAECGEPRRICNGITVRGEAQVVVKGSEITENADWGVGAVLKACGYPSDDFSGEVRFEGQNTIEGNNASRDQTGRGNPGEHPWNGEDTEDGQVCLPWP